MKINEVEQLVGVTKRNIRFYEKEGLLSPGRTDNGYRDYSEADVEALRKIKLLRKLDVPLEEIRRMQQGTLTLTDGVRRHIIQLERAQDNLATMRSLCQELAEKEPTSCAPAARGGRSRASNWPAWTRAAGWRRWSGWRREERSL